MVPLAQCTNPYSSSLGTKVQTLLTALHMEAKNYPPDIGLKPSAILTGSITLIKATEPATPRTPTLLPPSVMAATNTPQGTLANGYPTRTTQAHTYSSGMSLIRWRTPTCIVQIIYNASVQFLPSRHNQLSGWKKFGRTCKSMRNILPNLCKKIHSEARDELTQPSPDAIVGIIGWIDRPAVRKRIQLTPNWHFLVSFEVNP